MLGAGLAALTAVSALAATKTWTGGTNSDWATGGNWTGGVPTSSDTAVINAGGNGPTVSAAGATASTVEVGTTAAGGTLGLQSGGTLSDTNGFVGVNASATGRATVDGSGSSWTNSNLFVGDIGTGTLTIRNGGSVSAASEAEIGLGAGGNGTLTIQSGGTLSDASGFLGVSAGSTGTATVDGSGSSWTNSSALLVGDVGTGTLTIRNGGSVSGGSEAEIGVNTGSNGTLIIQSGGTLSDAVGFLGGANAAGSVGTATVDGSGSSWTNSGGLIVGTSGTGTLTITNGGTVVVIGAGHSLTIAEHNGSIGTLNIGAASGSPAAAPGTVQSSNVTFGTGTGTIVFNHTSSAYVFAPAISGNGTIDALAGNTILTGDMSRFTGSMNVSLGGNLTTLAQQQASVNGLAADQRAAEIESRATAAELLGATRSLNQSNYIDYGGMFGSAVGYAGGQYANRGVTVLGGIAYGAQDYRDIRRSDAPTVAAAARYTFDDPFGGAAKALFPYAELGAWITPQATLTLNRNYADATGPALGQGSTDATSWAEYARTGLVWQASRSDQLVGYGELGQQYASFGSYTENNAGNPFPATIGGGLFRMAVARAGASWTHDLKPDIYAPLTITLAGVVARSFDVHSGLTANIDGFPVAAVNDVDTWGEFGARLGAQLNNHLSVSLDAGGTAGGGTIGTKLHGGVSVAYCF